MTVAERITSLTPEQRALFEKLREKQRKAARILKPPPILRVSGPTAEGDWPPSFDQERFWFMEQLFPNGAGLNITAATRMRGALSPAIVAAALSHIARRHAAWRTTFPVVDGKPVQRVGPARRQLLAVIDLEGLPAELRETEAFRLAGADTGIPFDLTRGPLIRSSLVRLSARDHLCLLTVHHSVTDWISFQITWAELAVFYETLAVGGRPQLPEPPVQYPDFAVWQREWLQGEVLDELTAWWGEQLSGFPAALDLPTDRTRPAAPRMRGARLPFAVPGDLSDRLRGLARQEGATLFMLVLAATAAVLYRDSGQEKLILGANNANRNRPEIEPVLGCFLTQVPFAIDLGGNPTFRELLARVRRSALGAYAHQDLPFGQLVQALQLERDPSRPPLIQALVQVLDGPSSKTVLADATFEVVDSYDGRARYDLMLNFFDDPDGLLGSLDYDADLFEAATTACRIQRFLLQTAAVAADPDLRVSALPVLPPAARHQALIEWNETLRPRPEWTAPQRFAEQAARTPDALAVEAAGETLSYRDLDRRATALARRLAALGVGVGSRVALLLERTPDLPVAIFGVWRAGGTYVPLDPDSPPARLGDLFADADPAVVVHRGPLSVALGGGIRSLDLAAAGGEESSAPPPVIRPDHLAYFIYTSGTTGKPKAVMIEHGALATTLGSFLDRYSLGPGHRVPHLSRYTFDASLLELVAPLLSGGSVEILTKYELLDPDRLLLAFERSTAIFSVPSLLRRLLTGVADRGPERFLALRALTIGGEVVPPDLQEALVAAFPSAQLDVVYGPTETTVICTAHRISRHRRPERTLIGRPLPAVETRIMDPRGELVAPGLPGELWIGGPGVARGYFRREELTAERFVEVEGRRFYRTGDLVRQVPAAGGELEFLGRLDFQIKVRGFRIEPGEVEAALLAHPAVREAVVVAHPGIAGDHQLVAYVVPAVGAAPPSGDLQAFLRQLLPEHMVPAIFVPLAALPVGANGKVDRKALPAPAAQREGLPGAAAPETAKEQLLAEIWRQVLGLARVGIHDNFFELGGDSILSIQIVARARRSGLLITPRHLFENQTIAGLAAVAESVEEGEAAPAGPVEGSAPLTPIQRRFFLEERLQPSRFNQAVMLVPQERLGAGLLAAALTRLAEHHDALRLRFLHQEGAWRQLHAPVQAAEESAPLVEIDLAGLSPRERERALATAAEQLQTGLDLAQGPIFTAALFRRREVDGDRLLLTAHHLVVDGVSWRVLLEDLAAALRRLDLPPKTTSWKRWAEQLAAYAGAPELAAEIPYWSERPHAPLLPTDRTDPHRPAGTATVSTELGPAETRALLQEAPEAYRTQVNDLLLAALARAFAAWTGESTLLVDLEGHGREEIFAGVDLSRTVGWFTTLFPVALSLPPGAGPREAIRTVKETLRAVPRRGIGYGLLRYLADPETRERLAALPAPQVSFNYLGRFDPAAGEAGLFAFAPEPPPETGGEAVSGRHRFVIDALVLNDRLRVNWTYDPHRHLPATAERLARSFLDELGVLIAHCLSPEAGGVTPSDFPLARLDQVALDRLLGSERDVRTVEDLYPLTPMQQGILFHSLYAPGGDLYFEQFTAELAGGLEAPAFIAAWRRVLARHPALRTAFVWQGVESPLQLVRRQVELPWTAEDWRTLQPSECERRWRDLLAADRARGFDLGQAPLMRLTLLRTGELRHRLIWSAHHLIFDGWCFSLLLTEVFALYAGAVSGAATSLGPPPPPYREYLAWLAARDENEAESFWRQTLRGFTQPTPVPFDRTAGFPPSHGTRADDYFERKVALPAPRVANLEALAQRLKVTLNTLVQGAWGLLLSRYAEVSDVVFGAVVSGRPAELPGVESMVGLFINSLPVRMEIPADLAASAWLARLQARQFELRQYEWTPLPRIQSLAEIPAGEPLFASLVVFENYPVAPNLSAQLGELCIETAAVSEHTNYPLTLIAAARGDLSLQLIADRRFEPATVHRMLAHFDTLLGALAADPERPLRLLPLLSLAEGHQLTVEWSGPQPAHPRGATIHGLFAAQAARTPDAVAVVCGDEELTYAQLGAAAGRIGARLLQLGLPAESRIAVVAERSPALIAALLGTLQAGCAYLPLDPELPEERLAFLLADAGVAVVLGERRVLAGLPRGEGPRVLAVEEDAAAAGPASWPAVAADQLAYVLYTSGSTGAPKGVAVRHGSVVRLAKEADYADFGPGEVLLQLVNVAFDLSTFEIWGPLLNGGRLAIFPARRPALDEIGAAIARHGVTTLWLTSGLFHQMVQERLESLRPLRQLLAGGDVLSPAAVRRALAGLPGCRLVDGYGPTENTTFTSCHAMTAADLADGRLEHTVPIGRPIRGTRVYVLDGELRPVPAGVWGELFAGGDGVARGYLARPDLTAASFVPDPFSGERGARLYRTGDVVRWRPDGVLEFLGRRDGQVKLRGFRIELGEIEAELARSPGVREAAVDLREDPRGERRLVAWVAADPESAVSPAALRRHLAARLPEPMLPAAFVAVDHLPLTANGKVDRRALPAPDGASEAQREYVAPSTPIEVQLAEVCAEVLERERVGMRDNFFELGGHSLLATQLVARLRDRYGLEVSLQMVFDAADLRELAEDIVQRTLQEIDGLSPEEVAALLAESSEARIAEEPPRFQPIRRLSREGDLPLSYAQERLWFLAQLTPGSAAYNMPLTLAVHGGLSVPTLEETFVTLVRRHESLRTTFPARDTRPVQAIAPPAGWSLPVVDLSALPSADAETARLATAAALRPFDLAQGPLLRTELLRLGPTEHVLLLTLHHIVADLWAAAVLLREVAEIYAGAVLPDLRVQYADFAVWQRGWLDGDELARQLAFWQRQLAGAPPVLELPTDRPRPSVESLHGASLPLAVGRELSSELTALARQRGATPFMALMGVLAVLLSRWAGQEDLVLGAPISNRPRPELEGLIGMFVNTLALRMRPSGTLSFIELLAAVRRTTLEAFEHQDLPFEKLVEAIQTRRDLSLHPVFQVMLAMQNVRLGTFAAPGLILEPLPVPRVAAKFDLTFTLLEGEAGLAGDVEYSTDLFDAATVERLSRHLCNLLAGIAKAPEAALQSLPLLSPAEDHQVTVEWSGPEPVHPRDATIHGLFAAQAARTPDAVAVVCGEQELTYAQLGAAAGRIGARLLRLGLPAESRIAVVAERSPALIAALLGTLQAGCAYLPLDPELPGERLEFLLADAGVAVVLGERRVLAGLPLDGWREGPRVLAVEEDDEAAAEPASWPAVAADQLAYVLYTSGSTGMPKGVAVRHGSVVRLVKEADYADLGAGEVVLQLVNVAFDVSTFEIWGPLLNGGRLAIFPQRCPALDEIGAAIARHGVTTLWLTSGLFHQMVQERLESLRPLRQLLAGGDVLSPAAVRRALSGLPGCRLIDGYGPTENTTFTSCHAMTAADLADGRLEHTVPIGRPIRGTRVYVLDGGLRPVPVGVWGELFAGGDGVARGYLARPDLTAASFAPDPFGGERGARLYRTGDVVRWRPDGALEFLGRRDGQVKLRGFRIELGEIEAALTQYPGVREAAVVLREDRLVAYVAADPAGGASPAALRRHLAARLPEPMLPAAFVAVDRLPLTANGKVDRRVLPAPDGASEAQREYVAPSLPIEVQLAEVCAEVLGRERVGMRDNFFELGGHSLLATQLVARLRGRYGLEVSLQTVFNAADLAELADRVMEAELAATAAEDLAELMMALEEEA
jgi:amino acid adenylation domain-containing protein/non-ribosomal peptide synthase protein (TIGR01720 family)